MNTDGWATVVMKPMAKERLSRNASQFRFLRERRLLCGSTMAMFKKAFNATSDYVKSTVSGEKHEKPDKHKEKEEYVKKRLEYGGLEDSSEQSSEAKSEMVDQAVLDLLDEIIEEEDEAPAQAGASSRPQPRSRRNSGTFSGFSHSAVVSSSRNEPQKPFHSPSKSTSENPMNAEMTRKLNKSTSAVGLSSSASKINFTQTPKIYIRPDQLKLSKNEDPEPSEFGTGKFQFSILGNVPLTPRWLSFIIVVVFPRFGTKMLVRRYRHIRDLHESLNEVYSELPPLPKYLSITQSPPNSLLVENHRLALQRFLNVIGTFPSLALQPAFISFLGDLAMKPTKMVRPRKSEFDDEEIDEKVKRDLTEWRILESMEWIAPLNTTLSKLSTLHCIVLSINDAKDWIHVSEEVQRMPVLAKLLDSLPTENRFVQRRLTVEEAANIKDEKLKVVVEMTLSGISELSSKLRRILGSILDPSTAADQLESLRLVAARTVEFFAPYSIVLPLDGYKFEAGTPDYSPKSWPSFFSTSSIQIPHSKIITHIEIVIDQNSPWFHDYFMGREHVNLIGSPDHGLIIVSFMADQAPDGFEFFRAIIRTEKGNEKLVAPPRGKELKHWNKDIYVIKGVLERMNPSIKHAELSICFDEDLPDDLIKFESRDMRVTPHFKIGVLYCAKGQKAEEEMFSNQNGSPEFDAFMELMGTKIALSGWNRYNGGLDIRGTDTTGTHSYFTTFHGYDVMYHVSTLFPYSEEGGAQQVHKKRHLGNDIVLVVFQDEDSEDYAPNCVRSQYIQVVIVVRKMRPVAGSNETHYKLSVVRNGDVPHFGPPLPYPSVFKKGAEFRSWILRKIINGELAAYRSPLFIKQLAAGFRSQCEELVNKYYKSSKSTFDTTAEVATKSLKSAGKSAGKMVVGVGSGIGKGMNKGMKSLMGSRKESEDKADKTDKQ